MKLSARNIIPGEIVEVKLGTVAAEIQIKIADGIVISSTITVASAKRLDLQVGKKAYAIIKASNVIVAVDEE